LLLIKITNGPTKEELIKAFANRQQVKMMLVSGTSHSVVINQLQHEDGSGYSFNFLAMSGAAGYYDTRIKQGYINLSKK